MRFSCWNIFILSTTKFSQNFHRSPKEHRLICHIIGFLMLGWILTRWFLFCLMCEILSFYSSELSSSLEASYLLWSRPQWFLIAQIKKRKVLIDEKFFWSIVAWSPCSIQNFKTPISAVQGIQYFNFAQRWGWWNNYTGLALQEGHTIVSNIICLVIKAAIFLFLWVHVTESLTNLPFYCTTYGPYDDSKHGKQKSYVQVTESSFACQ